MGCIRIIVRRMKLADAMRPERILWTMSSKRTVLENATVLTSWPAGSCRVDRVVIRRPGLRNIEPSDPAGAAAAQDQVVDVKGAGGHARPVRTPTSMSRPGPRTSPS